MVTYQEYECEVHGRFEKVVEGDAPDRVPCEHRVDIDGPPVYCDQMAEFRISAPKVSTPETRQRALTGHVRDSNPY